MIVRKEKGAFGPYDIRIEQNEDIYLELTFGGDGDLYWIYDNLEVMGNEEDSMYESFLIPKYEDIYASFNELYEDLINCRIYLPKKDLLTGENDEEECKESNSEIKKRSRYKKLVKDGIITWISDEEHPSIAEIVRITKTEEGILLEFIRQSKKDELGFSRIPGWYSIRFRTSGSTYTPCDIIFLRQFSKLQDYEVDIKPKEPRKLELTK